MNARVQLVTRVENVRWDVNAADSGLTALTPVTATKETIYAIFFCKKKLITRLELFLLIPISLQPEGGLNFDCLI